MTLILPLLLANALAAAPADTVNDIADRYFQARIAAVPELPYFVGLPVEDHAALSDNSPQAQAAWEQVEDQIHAALQAVDAEALRGQPEWITHGILTEYIGAQIGTRVCRSELWDVNHMGGWHGSYSRVADYQPVDTPPHRESALARWAQFDDYIDQEVANLQRGLAAGYSAPKSVVEKVIQQVSGMIEAPAAQAPFLSPARRASDEAFKTQFGKLHEEQILPALRRYRDFLTQTYLPAARTELSITANPDGRACYDASLRAYTSLDRPGEAVFELGQKTVAANRARVIELGEEQYGLDDFEAILARVADDPDDKFKSAEALLEASRTFVEKAEASMPAWFNDPPQQSVKVEPHPDYVAAAGASSRYEAPSEDRPGVYRINLHQPEEQSIGDAEVTAAHEAWPGHHLQIAIAQNVQGVHQATRLAFNSGFTEGWARYAEALAEEMGLYKSQSAPITRRAWPARGMVVDPGLHLYGWTREQVRDYILESRRMGPTEATNAADRIAMLPGQLTAYDSGALEIFALRRQAEAALGERFDIKAFHDRVLEHGNVPLPLMQANVEEWISTAVEQPE